MCFWYSAICNGVMTIDFSVFKLMIVDRLEQLLFCAPDFVCIAQRGQVNAGAKKVGTLLEVEKEFRRCG